LRAKTWIGLLALLVILSPVAFGQSRDTGAIVGKIVDEEGNGLPGVNVTLASPQLMGARATISDPAGVYRFPALPPGDYNLKAELQGFATAVREAVRVTTTTTLNIDLTMKPTAVAEEITVVAQSPTVDVKSTETASVTLSNEILRNIPYNQFTADIVNLAPGVDGNVAFGASQSTGIAYTMDGVNVADPEAGSAWVFMDHNAIEEAKVMGIGLPAEYGNFTGVIFNLVTKSGGNEFSGHFEFIYQGKKSDKPKGLWQTDNNQAYIEDFPRLSSPLTKLLDVGGHLGGPIKKDKLWFYVGTQFYRSQNYPTGFPEAVDYKQPRLFTKITSQLTPSLNLNVSLELDNYIGINRDSSSTVHPKATVTQDSPEIVGNFSLTKILSPKTFFDVKGAFFTGYYYLDPEVGMDPYMHFSLDENFRYDSAGYFFYADRTRFQVNGSLSHYTEDFIKGAHDFKFGVEAEYSKVRNRYGYSGKGGALGNAVKYFDYYGEPYLAYQYEGYDTNTRYARVEAFAQDNWQVSSRLNINLGLRLSQNWGFIKNVDGVVYNTTRLAPRVGLTFDVFGDKSTVLKAHYGQFTEAMLSSYHDRLNPDSAYKDYVGYYWDGEWVEMFRIQHESLYTMDPDIKHPYMDQITAGFERELFRDTSLGVTFIYRKWNNIVGRYDRLADYSPVDVYSAALNKTFTIYERTEDTVDTYDYLLTNIKKGGWITQTPYRKYQGIEVLFNKRFSNRWQLLASYVYGRATGTMDNGFADDIGYGGNVDDPNFWINSEGNSTFDPTHMLKLQGTYILPFDISFNAYFRLITGDAWTTRVRTSRLNQGRVTFFAEKRGSNHYPAEKTLDVRLEKIFTLASKYKLGLIVDVFNVFNNDTITSWGTRIGYDWNEGDYPSTDGHELYGIVRPRQARVGIRLIF
jgi:outer membrane receptor protein involved in Fe transport